MIIYTSNESQHLTLPPTWQSSLDLEAWTGADYLITPLTLPFHSKTLIARHLKAGAFLVNRKTGMDLVNSIPENGNLWDLVERMLTFCKTYAPQARPAQRIILGVGVYQETKDGKLWVGKHEAKNASYMQLSGAIERIFERDCTYTNAATNKEGFFKWMLNKEHHALDNKKHPIKYAVTRPEVMYEEIDNDLKNKPLQELIMIRDGRKTLVTFPQMGEVGANLVWEYAGENLARSLTSMSDPLLLREKNRPSGIGIEKIKGWRAYLGLKENQGLQITEYDS